MLGNIRAGGEGDNRGWDSWMASLTQWTWVWANSGSWWWTVKPDILQSMGLQRVGHDWVNWTGVPPVYLIRSSPSLNPGYLWSFNVICNIYSWKKFFLIVVNCVFKIIFSFSWVIACWCFSFCFYFSLRWVFIVVGSLYLTAAKTGLPFVLVCSHHIIFHLLLLFWRTGSSCTGFNSCGT